MPRPKTLGDLERQVLDFLLRRGPATAETVRSSVAGSLTGSTIRTVLRRLEAKRYLRHTVEGRQFLYSSVRQPRKFAAEGVREILKRFCRGSMEELLSGIVDYKIVDSAELRRLAEKIEAREEERRKV